jgi:plastocyanin
MRRIHLIVVVGLLAIAVAVTASVAFGATRSVGVKQSGAKFRFTPSTLTIRRGDTVRWSWRGRVPHNVKGPGFQSRTAGRVTFSHRFTRRGSFRIICTLHAALGQRMTVRVR